MRYVEAFEIASNVRAHHRGSRAYSDGVERSAALAAAEAANDEEAVTAMEAAFNRHLLAPHAWADPVI